MSEIAGDGRRSGRRGIGWTPCCVYSRAGILVGGRSPVGAGGFQNASGCLHSMGRRYLARIAHGRQ
jgi:hypothetical protein